MVITSVIQPLLCRLTPLSMGTNAPMCVMYKNSLHGRYLPDRFTVG